jgi:phosphoserine phosphatase
VKTGRFTGDKSVLRREKKLELLRELAAKHGADWQHSLGVGDSESDIPMLSAVEQPVAFNPTKQLFEHARAQNWKIVLERKSVIYELEPDDNAYRLVNTDG